MGSLDVRMSTQPSALRFELSQQERQRSKSATIASVWKTLHGIQVRQEAQRELKDLTRVQPFVDAIERLDGLFEGHPSGGEDVGLLRGQLRDNLQKASTVSFAFDSLLDAYQKIGAAVPALPSLQGTADTSFGWHKLAELICRELIEFHSRVNQFLNGPTWQQTFRPSWEAFEPRVAGFAKNLQELNNFVGVQQAIHSQASLASTNPITFNFQYINGSNYENVELSGGTHVVGDQYNMNSYSNFNENLFLDNQAQLQRRLDDIALTLDETKKIAEEQEKVQHNSFLDKVREWLAAPAADAHHEDVYKVHEKYPNTGNWILENPTLTYWMEEELPRKPVLWMHGIPGAGKTVLASVIAEACLQKNGCDSFFFYCKYDDPLTCKSTSILSSLLLQAVIRNPQFVPYVNHQQQKSTETTLCTERTARRLMDIVFSGTRRKYIVLDGVDECDLEQRQSILNYLTSFVKEADHKDVGKIRLLVISQEEPDIRKALKGAEELVLRQNDNQSDIKQFVTHWAGLIRQKFDIDQEDEKTITTWTCSNAAGQFLYAKLVMENLYAQRNVQYLRIELERSIFPKALAAAYERIILRIERDRPEDWDTAKQLLGWVTCAARPLKWHEIQGAVSIDFENEEVNFRERMLRQHVKDICGSLVSVFEDRITLVHSTARHFILTSEYLDAPTIDCELASLCMHYLAFECFDPQTDETARHDYIMNGYYAFADYAVSKWMHHFCTVLKQAEQIFSEPRRENPEVQVLCEAVEFFVNEYADELDTDEAECQGAPLDVRLDPKVRDLLRDFEESEPRFAKLWRHTQLYGSRNIQSRDSINLERLRISIEQVRNALEVLASDKSLPQSDKLDLETFYGKRLFRCSKINCFYFYEGFEHKDRRKRHVARHDRAYLCEVHGCIANELGFGTKRELESHTASFHPDAEIKSKLFKIPTTKPTNTRFRCSKCDKCFVRNQILKDHELTHTGQKPYECTKCGKAFTRKNDCTRHEKIHDRRR